VSLRDQLVQAVNGNPIPPDDAWALIHRWDRGSEALIEAAVVLEVLAGQIAEKAYRELSTPFQDNIVKARDLVRAALTDSNGEKRP
jgi:type VI protein secretion system component VasF